MGELTLAVSVNNYSDSTSSFSFPSRSLALDHICIGNNRIAHKMLQENLIHGLNLLFAWTVMSATAKSNP